MQNNIPIYFSCEAEYDDEDEIAAVAKEERLEALERQREHVRRLASLGDEDMAVPYCEHGNVAIRRCTNAECGIPLCEEDQCSVRRDGRWLCVSCHRGLVEKEEAEQERAAAALRAEQERAAAARRAEQQRYQALPELSDEDIIALVFAPETDPLPQDGATHRLDRLTNRRVAAALAGCDPLRPPIVWTTPDRPGYGWRLDPDGTRRAGPTARLLGQSSPNSSPGHAAEARFDPAELRRLAHAERAAERIDPLRMPIPPGAATVAPAPVGAPLPPGWAPTPATGAGRRVPPAAAQPRPARPPTDRPVLPDQLPLFNVYSWSRREPRPHRPLTDAEYRADQQLFARTRRRVAAIFAALATVCLVVGIVSVGRLRVEDTALGVILWIVGPGFLLCAGATLTSLTSSYQRPDLNLHSGVGGDNKWD